MCLKLLETYGPVQACDGIDLSLPLRLSDTILLRNDDEEVDVPVFPKVRQFQILSLKT
jgi:hypothetical protein